MNTTDRIRSFLEAATAGLKDDRELQMETRSELASHLEAASLDLIAGGLPEDQAADQALKTLGPATDIAADFVNANRSRMKLRARLQIAVRALVVPIAVLLALSTFFRVATGIFLFKIKTQDTSHTVFRVATGSFLPLRLSTDKQLILHGDRSRHSQLEQARAIWEAHPTNVVYLNNYITVLTTEYNRFGDIAMLPPNSRLRVIKENEYHKLNAGARARLTAYDKELKLAEKVEPDNARFHYLMAGKLLAESSAIIVKNPADTNRQEEMTLVISNALSFNQAMDELKTALKKPYYRRYLQDMTYARQSILGKPETMMEQIEWIATAAGVLLPDLGPFRTLARTACLQAERLVAEGHPDEARVLLEACPAMAISLYRDAFCLVDVFTARAIIGIYSNQAPALYERMGDQAAAATARHKADVISRPVTAWHAKIKAISQPKRTAMELEMRHKGGRMTTALLLPHLDEEPSDEDYRSSRLLEYMLAERVTVEAIMFVLLLVLIASLAVALRWRFARGGASAPLLLLPDGKTALRIVLFGTLLPIAGFYIYTRWLPLGGRDFSATYIWPKLLLQVATLAALVIGITAMLAADAVRRRCQCLGVAIPSQRFQRPVRAIFMTLTGVALAGCLVPSPWLTWASSAYPAWYGTTTRWGGEAAVFVAGLLAAYLLILGIVMFFRFLRGSSIYGLFYGTATRSLVPSLAVAMILLSLIARTYLAAEERDLVRHDTTISLIGGFSATESRLVQRLKQETLDAVQSLNMAEWPSGTEPASDQQAR